MRLYAFLCGLALVCAAPAMAQQAAAPVNSGYTGTAQAGCPSAALTPCFMAGGEGYVSSPVTPSNASHAAGVSMGGLMTVPIGQQAMISGIGYKSIGGDTGQKVIRAWLRNPVNTTCTDNANFVGSDADDAFRIVGFPLAMTPAAPANVQGDSATYADLTGMSISVKNQDVTATPNIYVCIVTNATDTADQNKIIRLTLAGPTP